MVGFGTVGVALSVVVVLEFDSACWAVCDAHGLCFGEYLFSELFVFFCACSAHRCFLFSFLFVVCVRWWRVAASARRAPPPSNTTLCSLFFFVCCSFSFCLLWNGGCRVVRAQLCEHARDTTAALCSGFVYCVWCVLLLPQRNVCCPHHTLFNVNDHHAHH